MLVWGGGQGTGLTTDTGGKYDPKVNSWEATSLAGAPAARQDHVAVWTGAELVVWGGLGVTGAALQDGGHYSPSGDSWQPAKLFKAPVGSTNAPKAAWTGDTMLIFPSVFGADAGCGPTLDVDPYQFKGAVYTPSGGCCVPPLP